MTLLDNLHNDFRVIKLEDMQEKIDKDMPDGYKMKLFHCSLPTNLVDRQKMWQNTAFLKLTNEIDFYFDEKMPLMLFMKQPVLE